jgi:hypothetical protein
MTLKHAYLLGIYSGAFPLGSCSSVLLFPYFSLLFRDRNNHQPSGK